jgi:hypothetical protein
VSLLGTELHRIDTVIGILLVASCKTAAATTAFPKLQRNIPDTELYLVSDQLWLAAGMIRVTCPAGLPAFLPVYMKVMQIDPAIAKIRIRSRVVFARDFFRMAGKAEGIPGGGVRRGNAGWIIGEKQLAVAPIVRHVAGEATLICYRAMLELCRLNLILHLVMAEETQIRCRFPEQTTKLVVMRSVALGAGQFFCHCIVLERARFHVFLYFLVASVHA